MRSRKRAEKKAEKKAAETFAYDRPEHFAKAMNAFLTGDDRTVAIIGASLVENALEQSLRFYVCHNNDAAKALFDDGGNGVLGTFSAKIHMAAALGVIGPITYEDLDRRIRKIRNYFAHTILMPDNQAGMHPVSFKAQTIRDLCNDLKFVKEHMGYAQPKFTPSWLYKHTCISVAGLLVFCLQQSKGGQRFVTKLP